MLVLAMTEGCAPCVSAAVAWAKGLSLAPRAQVFLIADAEGPNIRGALRNLRTVAPNVTLLRPRDLGVFRARTGITGVPAAMVLDSANNVRVFVAGSPATDAVDAAVATLRDLGPNPNLRVFRGGAGQPLIRSTPVSSPSILVR